jgi:hypothetical protein
MLRFDVLNTERSERFESKSRTCVGGHAIFVCERAQKRRTEVCCFGSWIYNPNSECYAIIIRLHEHIFGAMPT